MPDHSDSQSCHCFWATSAGTQIEQIARLCCHVRTSWRFPPHHLQPDRRRDQHEDRQMSSRPHLYLQGEQIFFDERYLAQSKETEGARYRIFHTSTGEKIKAWHSLPLQTLTISALALLSAGSQQLRRRVTPYQASRDCIPKSFPSHSGPDDASLPSSPCCLAFVQRRVWNHRMASLPHLCSTRRCIKISAPSHRRNK